MAFYVIPDTIMTLFFNPSTPPDKDVNHSMRSVLVDWLTQVQHHLKISEETLYRTVHTLDLVLSLRSVEPAMLQLVGVTSMLVASKLEEYYPVEIAKMLHLTENSYKRTEVLNMERIILQLVGFKVSSVINSPSNPITRLLLLPSSSCRAPRPSCRGSPGRP